MRINTTGALLFAAALADSDEKTSIDVVSAEGFSMTLEYYVGKIPDDEFSPLYLYFETTLSGLTPLTEDLLIGQWYNFYQIDEEKTEEKREEERERAEQMGEEEVEVVPHYIFYEAVDGSLIHPGTGDIDFEDLRITQQCSIDEEFVLPCPW